MIDYTNGLDVGGMILEGVTLKSLSNQDLVCLYESTQFTASGYNLLMEEVWYRFLKGPSIFEKEYMNKDKL